MPEWGWVTLAFCVAYGALAGYAAVSAHRLRTIRRRLEKRR